MARTKGDGGAARSVGAKAPRKALGGGSSGASYNPLGQPVPGWQKPMTSFFTRNPNTPPSKRKEDTDDTDKEDKENIDDDQENEPPKKKEKEEPKDDVVKAQKNGIIDDSDDE